MAVSFSFYFPHTTADMFLNITYLISHRKCVTTIQDRYRMTHKHSLHIRLAKWRLSDLRERLIFANKLFTRVSFCSSSGSSSIVIGSLTFFVAFNSPLQSESPEQTALMHISTACPGGTPPGHPRTLKKHDSNALIPPPSPGKCVSQTALTLGLRIK